MKKFYSFFLIIAVAMFSFVGGAQAQTTYKMITSLEELVDGEYVIGTADKDLTEATMAMGSYNSSNYYSAVAKDFASAKITLYDDATEKVYKWTMKKDGDYFTIQSVSTENYVTSSGDDNTKTYASSEISDNGYWSVTYDNGRFVFTTKTVTARALRYNYNQGTNSRFTTYGSTYPDLFLYLKESATVENPTFSVESSDITGAKDITINCETEGVDIYYTTDETEPSAINGTKYSSASAITISESTTIKAIAIKDDESSNVVTTTYSFYTKITSLDDLVDGEYIIGSAASTTATEATTMMSSSNAGSYYYSVDTDLFNDAIIVLNENTYSWNIKQDGDNYTLQSVATEMFVQGSSSTSATAVSNTESDFSKWTVSYSSSDRFVFTNCSTTTRMLRYNYVSEGISRFASYLNSSGYDLFLYRKDYVKPAVAVETPTFSPESCDITETTTVEIFCTTVGATIYYTTDDAVELSAITGIKYENKAITIDKTTTLRAIAISGTDISSEATATYRYLTPMTIAEYILEADEDNNNLLNDVTVTFQSSDRKYTYVQDNTGSLVIYASSAIEETLTNGQVLSGVIGKYATFNGVIQLQPTTVPAATAGTAVDPIVYDLADLGDAPMNSYIKLLGVTMETAVELTAGSYNSTNLDISQYGVTSDIYAYSSTLKNVSGSYSVGDVVEIVAISSVYNTAKQILPISIDLMTVATPTFSEEAGDVTAGTKITISCATELATIYYTIDGTVPTAKSNEYSEPYEITTSTVINAIAVIGDAVSEVATVTYTVDGKPVNVENTTLTNNVYSNNGVVYVECEAGAKVDVYSILGQRIYSETATSTMNDFNVNNQNVVIVVVDGVATKIAVK